MPGNQASGAGRFLLLGATGFAPRCGAIGLRPGIFSYPRVYPELFAVMGGRVPDLRGLFLRGTGGNAAALGAIQGDGVKLPEQGGSFAGRANASAVVAWSNPYTGVFQQSGEVVIRAMGRGWDYDEVWNRVIFNLGNASTAPETRPINRSVRYLVRARP